MATDAWFWCMHCEEIFRATREAFGTVEVQGGETIIHLPDSPLLCPASVRGDCDGGPFDVFPCTDYPSMPLKHWPPIEQWQAGDRLPLYPKDRQ
jgi:hypothetical protein